MAGAAAALCWVVLLEACASQQCDFHSQCGERFYCELGRCKQDCRLDLDCDPGQACSAIGQCGAALDGGPRPDAGPLMDAGPGPSDAGRDAGPPIVIDGGPTSPDSGSPPPDAGPPTGTGRYLDRCSSGGECASGQCVADVGGTRMCTISCAAHADCASEHVCGGDGLCHPDDTGTTCTLSSPTSCALGLCVGNAASGTGHCTRGCDDASECPAGYACASAGGGAGRVCMNIEHGCASTAMCESGSCLSVQGCTVECRTAADCPRRFGFLPPYTCEVAFGSASPICVPPSDVLGSDPIGASCPATGSNTCRSGACDPEAPLGPMCTQACTQEGGCGPGLGCWPSIDGADLYLLCSRAGSRALGQACTSGRECDSGLCDAAGSFCTRLCTDDGLCPTGWRCDPVPGYPVSICRR